MQVISLDFKNFNNNQKLIIIGLILKLKLKNMILAWELKKFNYFKPLGFNKFDVFRLLKLR